jgi:hypothetical protein
MLFLQANIYEYSLETGLTTNRTEDNPGYDVAPQFSPLET